MMSHNEQYIRSRVHLRADSLIGLLRERFDLIVDKRRSASTLFSLTDCLMSAFAMFSIKEDSLLAFDGRRNEPNLKSLFQIQNIPSDTQMREVLDPVEVDHLNEGFADIFAELQRAGVLEDYVFHDGSYLIAIDGTGYYCSNNIHCPHCLKHVNKADKTQYAHQAVAAVMVHPKRKEVIAMAVEPIIQQDGATKNDCERNATRRLLKRFRKQHPKLKSIIVEDALASNGPHIRDLIEMKFDFLLGVKPGDHKVLFDEFIAAMDGKRPEGSELQSVSVATAESKNTQVLQWMSNATLNASHPDLLVTFLQQMELNKNDEPIRRFSWVSSLSVTQENVTKLASGGRSRWKIENETFNTLKNQGYNLEHSYGHGQQNLSTVFLLLMFLAFLVDQVQQATCPLFQAAIGKFRTHKAYWKHLWACYTLLALRSWEELYRMIASGRTDGRIQLDTG